MKHLDELARESVPSGGHIDMVGGNSNNNSSVSNASSNNTVNTSRFVFEGGRGESVVGVARGAAGVLGGAGAGGAGGGGGRGAVPHLHFSSPALRAGDGGVMRHGAPYTVR